MSVLRSACLFGRLGVSAQSSYKLSYNQIRCIKLKPSCAPPKEDWTHEERNAIAGRPLSPHLTIYKPQLTSMMSISHRLTGMALSSYALMLAGASFLSHDIPHYVCTLQGMALPGALIMLSKLILAFPATYHLFNGLRHLVWDMGKALTLKEVYLGGYVTIGLAAAFALWLAI